MNAKKSFLLGVAPAALGVVIAGCGGGGGGGGATGAAAAPANPSAGTGVAVRPSKLGNILVDAKGRTLYLFEADKTSASTCYSACASIWPPLATSAAPTAGTGVKAALLGSTKRKDGTSEVTYNGHPLYYYAGDGAPGATTGQGLNQFGAAWYVLAPSGNKIDNG
jgi:predicted lipoprotein with Yx(FWY)xxD motif